MAQERNNVNNIKMNKQIIAFIDPSRFYSLLGDINIENYRTSQNGEDVWFDEQFKIIIINSSGTATICIPSSDKLNQAPIILVPDNIPDLMHSYIPKCDFKILFHNGTNCDDPYFLNLKLNNNCKGYLKDHEEPKSVYADIATSINDRLIPVGLWNKIKEFDFLLEAKLEILHECLVRPSIFPKIDKLLFNLN